MDEMPWKNLRVFVEAPRGKSQAMPAMPAMADCKTKRVNIMKRKMITPKIRFQVFLRDGGKCVKCGTERSLEIDHIEPARIAPEKQLELSNLQTLCANCHREKTGADIQQIIILRQINHSQIVAIGETQYVFTAPVVLAGRISIPAPLRRALKIKVGDFVRMTIEKI